MLFFWNVAEERWYWICRNQYGMAEFPMAMVKFREIQELNTQAGACAAIRNYWLMHVAMAGFVTEVANDAANAMMNELWDLRMMLMTL